MPQLWADREHLPMEPNEEAEAEHFRGSSGTPLHLEFSDTHFYSGGARC
jgi:hypothetical protein